MRSNIRARIPGLDARRNRDGSTRYYWRATAAARRQGYKPATVRLHAPEDGNLDLDRPEHREFVEWRCAALQAEMNEVLRASEVPAFDGTVAGLIRLYETDEISPYRRLKHKTQLEYGRYLKVLRQGCGARRLDSVKAADIWRWYRAALAPAEPDGPEHVRWARGLMVVLKVALGFGVIAEIPHCVRLRGIMSAMRFRTPRPRRSRPSYTQARAVFDAALREGCLSVALGTALQFEGMLRQYDVTGVWEPVGAGENASLTLNGRRWSGIAWSDIGEDCVLRWTSPKRDRYVEIDLAVYPMIAAALAAAPKERRVGPVIVDERSGLPYAEGAYGRRWRGFADTAGLPPEIWNRDLRAGGVTEGREAGASIEDVSRHAGHSDPGFTARVYDRGHLEAARRVAPARVKHREKGKP